MYSSMVSAYENVHIRSNLPRLAEATKFANSAGDRCAIHLLKVIFVKPGYLQDVYKPSELLLRPNQTVHWPTAYVTLHFGHNPSFLMNDSVDELVGAAEEVVTS
jgi:hypothetical protein